MRKSARCLEAEESRGLEGEERLVRMERAQRLVAVQARGESSHAVHVMPLDLDQPERADVEAESQRGIVLPALEAPPPADVGNQERVVGAGLEPGIHPVRLQRVASFAERQSLGEQ